MVLDVLNMLVSFLYFVCMYALDYILPDIGDMILAAGVWCCTCAALNVLSRPCTILCDSLLKCGWVTSSIACTQDYLGHYMLQGFGAALWRWMCSAC